jgi:hypothetical protein
MSANSVALETATTQYSSSTVKSIIKSSSDCEDNQSLYRSLYRMNRAFLDLSVSQATSNERNALPNGIRLGWSPSTLRSLIELPEPALDRLAVCPYALFELPLHASHRETDPAQRRYVSALLFEAWHIAHVAPARAMLWFCISASDVGRLRSYVALDVGALADNNAASLRARNPEAAHYWQAMIEAARLGDPSQLKRAQLLGRLLVRPRMVA